MKQEIYNLIILDESGSMSYVRQQTINGCNETINTIRMAQEKFGETQQHFVSIFAFQRGGTPSRFLMKNVPIDKVRHITSDDYLPCGSTPLYDAVGSTLVDLKSTVKDREMAIGSVTIITDGEENSSREYNLPRVARMIDELKELGWNFNFIGANIDVAATAKSLNIDNHLEFQQDEEGTDVMFAKERQSRMAYAERLNDSIAEYCTISEPSSEAEREARRRSLRDKLKQASKKYFD